MARDRTERLGAAGRAPPEARRRTGARTGLAGPGPRMEGARCARATERAGHARRLCDPRRKARLAADPGAPARAPADAFMNSRCMKQIENHTDGASTGNTGPGGWPARRSAMEGKKVEEIVE